MELGAAECWVDHVDRFQFNFNSFNSRYKVWENFKIFAEKMLEEAARKKKQVSSQFEVQMELYIHVIYSHIFTTE